MKSRKAATGTCGFIQGGARRGWVAIGMALLALGAPSPSQAQSDPAARASSLIAGLDFDEARRILASADPDDPRIALERARLAIYELDCDAAATTLARSDVQKVDDGELLADIARGCQRVTAALAGAKDEVRGIEVHWQDEHDAALAPLLFDTIATARDAITRDLGVDWPRPTRVVVVRDLLSLSAMTGLPYASAQTTGTVAVAKWGRITLLSPRASRHGYVWRDTLAHELTHLAVTRATADLAPLWLQEGVAKREEVRWRAPGPFDDKPPVDAVAERGIELHLAPSLDQLGPSIAMLPSAGAATVAFAEVTSFVRFYLETEGAGALPKLLAELKRGKGADGALRAASGADLKGWDAKWRAFVASRPRVPLPGILAGGGGVGGVGAGSGGAGSGAAGAGAAGSGHASGEASGTRGDAAGGSDGPGWRDLRDRSRLGELLLARSHPNEALIELSRGDAAALSAGARVQVATDASLRWLRARALEAADRMSDASPLVADAQAIAGGFAPWWATRGRFARQSGDDASAVTSFIEAISADPFDPEAACETLSPTAPPKDVAKAPLCDAARAGAEVPFGGD